MGFLFTYVVYTKKHLSDITALTCKSESTYDF